MSRKRDDLGYARVSMAEQDLTARHHRLRDTGVMRIFDEVISGKKFDRPGFAALIDGARSGDTLKVTRPGRLG